MSNKTTLYVLLFFLCAHSVSFAQSAKNKILPFKAIYTLQKGIFKIGEVHRTLYVEDEGRFVYRSRSIPTGIISLLNNETVEEKSRWQYHNGRPRPSTYSYKRYGGRRHRQVQLVFKWDKLKVTNIINNDLWQMKIPEHTVDKLLYQLILMSDLAQGRKTLSYAVADGGLLKKFDLEIIGIEKIDTELGRLETIKLRRQHAEKTFIIWCAEKYHYLPVIIEQTDKQNGVLKLTLRDVQWSDPIKPSKNGSLNSRR